MAEKQKSNTQRKPRRPLCFGGICSSGLASNCRLGHDCYVARKRMRVDPIQPREIEVKRGVMPPVPLCYGTWKGDRNRECKGLCKHWDFCALDADRRIREARLATREAAITVLAKEVTALRYLYAMANKTSVPLDQVILLSRQLGASQGARYLLEQKIQKMEDGIERVRQDILAEIRRRPQDKNLGKMGCVRRLDNLLKEVANG